MLSGVGPKEELEKHGIPTLHDFPQLARTFRITVSHLLVLSWRKIQIRLPEHSKVLLQWAGLISLQFDLRKNMRRYPNKQRSL
jgi:hypothetical protein